MKLPLQRVLVVCQDSHLSLALQVLLTERGYSVRCERDSRHAIEAIKEFAPDALLTACDDTLYIGRRNAVEISELPRPFRTEELLCVLENPGVLTMAPSDALEEEAELAVLG
jgi:hypothetical protein